MEHLGRRTKTPSMHAEDRPRLYPGSRAQGRGRGTNFETASETPITTNFGSARELVQPSEGFGSMSSGLPIASTFWQGVNVKGDRREQQHLDRLLSVVTASILNHLLPAVEEAASKFMEAVIWPTDGDMKKNLRGNHFFCGAGHDRNNKKVPSLSKWHTANAKAVEAFFAPGQPLHAATRYGCSLLEKEFPDIAQRYKTCAEEMKRKFNISPLFGGFYWNFCLNGVRLGGPTPVPRVFCKPHIDFKNLALGVCMIFVYGHFDHKEKCWLVIWEAGIALELPMGIFVLYPSSLFLHFNVDADNLQFVVTDGNEPTKDSCRPLSCLCGDPYKDHGEKWQKAHGRGSLVWFNQASMFQTTELGYNTVEEARSAGAETDCDIKGLLEKGIFPQFTSHSVARSAHSVNKGAFDARLVHVNSSGHTSAMIAAGAEAHDSSASCEPAVRRPPVASLDEPFNKQWPLEIFSAVLLEAFNLAGFTDGLKLLNVSRGIHEHLAQAVYRDIFLTDQRACRLLIGYFALFPAHPQLVRRVYVRIDWPKESFTLFQHALYRSFSSEVMQNTGLPNRDHIPDLVRALDTCRDTIRELVVDGIETPVEFGRIFTDSPLDSMASLEAPLWLFSANAKVRRHFPLGDRNAYSEVVANWSSLCSVRLFIDLEGYQRVYGIVTSHKQTDFRCFAGLTSICLVISAAMPIEKALRLLLHCRVGAGLKTFAVEWCQGEKVPFSLDSLTRWAFDSRVVLITKVSPEELIRAFAGNASEENRALLHRLVWVAEGEEWASAESRADQDDALPYFRHKTGHVVLPQRLRP
ncbi:hypothetical protein AAF712_005108 [Marasmius tenuissimus]|uniref:Uncharacterized protein n=1 Tax=Marasmius tenuissimus TaxID=585030 RepID=A0ABR3A3J2_9AGAR